MALEEPLQAFTSLCGTLNALVEPLPGFTRLTELANFYYHSQATRLHKPLRGFSAHAKPLPDFYQFSNRFNDLFGSTKCAFNNLHELLWDGNCIYLFSN